MTSKQTCAYMGVAILLAFGTAACGRASGGKDLELKRFPLDTPGGVIQMSGVEVDRQVKADGAGSLKITVTEPSIIRLFETGPLDADDAALVYRASLRTENAQGNVYLEMWCRFPGKGEFFSRGLDSPLRGSVDWTTLETAFFLKPGDIPDNVKLNVVSEGPGIIWIDDIRLIKRTL
jgi:hypothetical protein